MNRLPRGRQQLIIGSFYYTLWGLIAVTTAFLAQVPLRGLAGDRSPEVSMRSDQLPKKREVVHNDAPDAVATLTLKDGTLQLGDQEIDLEIALATEDGSSPDADFEVQPPMDSETEVVVEIPTRIFANSNNAPATPLEESAESAPSHQPANDESLEAQDETELTTEGMRNEGPSETLESPAEALVSSDQDAPVVELQPDLNDSEDSDHDESQDLTTLNEAFAPNASEDSSSVENDSIPPVSVEDTDQANSDLVSARDDSLAGPPSSAPTGWTSDKWMAWQEWDLLQFVQWPQATGVESMTESPASDSALSEEVSGVETTTVGEMETVEVATQADPSTPAAIAAPAPALAPAEGEIVVENPAKYRTPLAFLVNGRVISLEPGGSYRYTPPTGTEVVIRYHRGGDQDLQDQQTLEPGHYTFEVKPIGWDLQRDTP